MDLKYLKTEFHENYDIEPIVWFSSLIKIKDEVVINKNTIVICFERLSCFDETNGTHESCVPSCGMTI